MQVIDSKVIQKSPTYISASHIKLSLPPDCTWAWITIISVHAKQLNYDKTIHQKTMEQLDPGSLVQYQGSMSSSSSWPAVVCTDDMAPKDLLRSRPCGVSTVLILILGSLIFRWATLRDLSEYDPFVPILQGEIVARVPGLGDAYGMANNHLDSSLDLEYWRERMRGTITIDSDLESGSGDSMDTEFQQALRESRDDYLCNNPASRSLLTPSQSPLKILPSPQVSRTVATQKPTRLFGVSLTNSTIIDLTDEEDLTDEPNPKGKEPATKPLFQQSSILDSTSLSNILKKKPATP